MRDGCVENGLKPVNGVCSSEDVNGTRDVWSWTEASSSDHLVVMVHGILGRLGFRRFQILSNLGLCG